MELLVESHQVALQHGHGDLSYEWYVNDTRDFEQCIFVDVFERCNVDNSRIGIDPFCGEFIVLCRYTSYDNGRLATTKESINEVACPNVTEK